MKETPISSLHRQLGALMESEDGWRMPQQFHSLIEEHLAMRSACAIFDISHMAKFHVAGNGALEWLESMLTNRIASCQDGHLQKTLMLDDKGGILDKMTLMRESAGRFLLLGHAAMAESDFDWLAGHQPNGSIELQNCTEQWSAMALCGPDCGKVFARVLPELEMPAPMEFSRPVFLDDPLIISRIGMPQDDGFELFCPANRGIRWFESFISAGAVPCGSKTRENRRIACGDACSCRDLKGMTPHEASLDAYCDKEKTYIGSEMVARQEQYPCEKKLVALRCFSESDVPKPGASVVDEAGNVVGHITTACLAPHKARGTAFAYMESRLGKPGSRLRVIVDELSVPVEVSEQSVC